MPAPPIPAPHIPVLLAEALETLEPRDGGTYIDATFGAGGYTRAILEAGDTRVIALDRDPAAIAAGFAMSQAYAPRLTLKQAHFAMLASWGDDPEGAATSTADAARPVPVDGVVFDLGVSSMQLDQPERGFSFQHDGPLDMRMFAAPGLHGGEGPSAADLVNELPEEQLAGIIFHYGEERRSRAIARAIVKARTDKPLTRTLELAELVARALGGRKGEPRHPATRTFQALRIAVNDELGQLASGLSGAEKLLKPGGRLVVVSFHSLEDRIVKRFVAERSKPAPAGSRHLPDQRGTQRAPSFRIVNSKPLTPWKGEADANPRARSARLRAAERTAGAAWPLDLDALGLPRVG